MADREVPSEFLREACRRDRLLAEYPDIDMRNCMTKSGRIGQDDEA